MRGIQFRGKRLDNGEWVYGYYVVAAGMPFISAFAVREPILVDPATVGQYTCLKDKNSVEIYEGDIVRLKGNPAPVVAKIDCLNGCFGLWYPGIGEFWTMVAHNFIFNWAVKVIGNVHDNPELLEGDADATD